MRSVATYGYAPYLTNVGVLRGDAWADQYSATPEEYRKEFGLIVENLGSAVVLAMPENEDIFFNRVIGLGLQEPAEVQMVDDLLSFLSWANVRR